MNISQILKQIIFSIILVCGFGAGSSCQLLRKLPAEKIKLACTVLSICETAIVSMATHVTNKLATIL